MQENRTAIRIAIQSNVFITGPPLILPTVQVVVAISSSGLIHICTVSCVCEQSLFEFVQVGNEAIPRDEIFEEVRREPLLRPHPLPIPRLLSVVDQNIPIVAHIINV